MDCLLKENLELKTKVEEEEAFQKEIVELKDGIAALEEEVKTTQEERDKSKEVAQKIHSFMGFPSDVNKAPIRSELEAAGDSVKGQDDEVYGGL